MNRSETTFIIAFSLLCILTITITTTALKKDFNTEKLRYEKVIELLISGAIRPVGDRVLVVEIPQDFGARELSELILKIFPGREIHWAVKEEK